MSRSSQRAVLGVLLLLAAALGAWRCSGSSGRYNLLVVLVDTLRADHLGCQGYGRETSRTIDALAREGVVFEEAFSAVPWTPASTATLLTGLEPFRHGFVRPEVAPLSQDAITLAEILGARGYSTAGFSGNLLISDLSGFDQGFETFKTVTWGKAPALNALAIPWLRAKAKAGRFFLYMHYFDPHDPYDDPAGNWRTFAGLAPDAPPNEPAPIANGDIEVPFVALREGRDPGLGPDELRRLIDRYDGEIRFVDSEIAKLLAEVKALGLEDETIVVFTSDHGEQFLEHGGLKHGSSLHREELHVPLVFKIPGRAGAPERRPDIVGLVDVVPTLLAALGVEPPVELDGVDLFGPPPVKDRLVFSETSHGWATVNGKREEGKELLAGRTVDGRVAMIGPPGDPRFPRGYGERAEKEIVDVAERRPDWYPEFIDRILGWRKTSAERVLPNRPMSPEDFKRLRDGLEALGYLKKAKPLQPPEGEHDDSTPSPNGTKKGGE